MSKRGNSLLASDSYGIIHGIDKDEEYLSYMIIILYIIMEVGPHHVRAGGLSGRIGLCTGQVTQLMVHEAAPMLGSEPLGGIIRHVYYSGQSQIKI